jgi:hypothetical protein
MSSKEAILGSVISVCVAATLALVIFFSTNVASIDSGHTKGQIQACAQLAPNAQPLCLAEITGNTGNN